MTHSRKIKILKYLKNFLFAKICLKNFYFCFIGIKIWVFYTLKVPTKLLVMWGLQFIMWKTPSVYSWSCACLGIKIWRPQWCHWIRVRKIHFGKTETNAKFMTPKFMIELLDCLQIHGSQIYDRTHDFPAYRYKCMH